MRRWWLAGLVALPMSLSAQQPPASPLPVFYASSGTLVVSYTNGTVTAGGFQQQIPAGTVTVTDTERDCRPPVYLACNLLYWSGGPSVQATTSTAVAFAAGNVLLAYLTTGGGKVLTLIPATSTTPGNAADGSLAPGFRFPLCNRILQQGCQDRIRTLSGY